MATHDATVTATAAATISSGAVVVRDGTATLAATSDITSGGHLIRHGTATLAATSDVTSGGHLIRHATADLPGSWRFVGALTVPPKTWRNGIDVIDAATLNQEIRDQMEKVGGLDWVPYLPDWRIVAAPSETLPYLTTGYGTIGNGSLTGDYCDQGNLRHFRIRYTRGSTTTDNGLTGRWAFTLPDAPAHMVHARGVIKDGLRLIPLYVLTGHLQTKPISGGGQWSQGTTILPWHHVSGSLAIGAGGAHGYAENTGATLTISGWYFREGRN